MEGVKNGRRLFKVFKQVASKKPIIILKSGRSPAGVKAALSHTGSIGVEDRIFDAVCKQTGVIRISGDLDELLDVTKAFALQPLPKGNRVAIITVTGAGGVMTADECDKNNLQLAALSNEILNQIRCNMPPWASVSNPVDIEPLFERVGPEDSIKIALKAALEDRNVDSIIVVFVAVPRLIPFFNAKNIVKEVFENVGDPQALQKPILGQLIGFKDTVDSWATQLEGERIPVYSSIERCAKSLGQLWKYRLYQIRRSSFAPSAP